ncbi:diacylglycerol kinase family protein [Pseudoroseomonas cervicalis]|uniref:diacylglycerol/lipid kinase family protein n=1 Tax=Teichococcus cervicalis TaxID=204525 RepID=UPI0022F166E4|nr:diacylglycerol kinase family protein [Pseudoroseomonas cervicalis]WBV44998.1 diacylglycerol kinase family protein [Pseudoroseomonas cervicalis]
MRATLFHNPGAGDETHSAAQLAGPLRASGLALRLCEARGDSLRDGLRQPMDLAIIAGGDGTVGRIAPALAGRGVALAVLPCGTANNLARALGPWSSVEALAEGWRQAPRRTLNLAYAEGPFGRQPFLEAAGFGAFARAIDRADEKGLKGIEAGRAAFRAILANTAPQRVALRIDGAAWEGETLLLEVMNIPLFGPNLRLAPGAAPDDGALDLVLLPPERRGALLDWLDAPEREDAPVLLRRGREIRIDWPGGPVRLDDTPLTEEAMTVTLGLEERVLPTLVPQALERVA